MTSQAQLDNATTAITSIAQGTADTNAFEAQRKGTGVGVVGRTRAPPMPAWSASAAPTPTPSTPTTPSTSTPASTASRTRRISSGVLAEGPTAVYAYGDWAVYADGASVGIFAGAYPSGTAVHAHAGERRPPAETTNVALRGNVSSTTQAGIQAYGRVQFPNRSGRVTFSSGQSAKAVTVSGMTSTNYALAVLNSNKTGYYVRAVVPAAGKITIYLNKAATSSTVVAWLVLG